MTFIGSAGIALASGRLCKEDSSKIAEKYGANAREIEPDDPLAVMVQKIAADYGIKNPVDIFFIDNPEVPALCTKSKGNRNLIIVDKNTFEKLDAEEQKFIIAHEMGHLARGDFERNLISGAIDLPTQFSMIAGIATSNTAAVVLNIGLRTLGIMAKNVRGKIKETAIDRTAVDYTGNEAAAISALEKLVADRDQIAKNKGIEAAQRLADSFPLGLLLSDHPRTENRLASLKRKP
jgi:Zn-dependent protease with chaperone function